MNNLFGICGQSQSGKDLTTKIIQTLIWLNKGNKLETPIEEFVLTNGIFVPKGMRGFTNVLSESGFKNKKFADKLKEIVCLLIGCERNQLEDNDFKSKELGEEWRIWGYQNYFNNHKVGEFTGLCSNEESAIKLEKSDRKSYQWDNDLKSKIESYVLTPRLLLQLLGTECGREIIHPNIWINALFSDYKIIDKRTWQDPDDSNICYPNWIISDVRFLNEVKAIKSRRGITIKKLGKEISNSTHASETELLNYKADYTIDWYDNISDLIEVIKQILIKEKIINQ